jgi:ATP-dependent Clp endopeptidase proteolytic subunit ClpP
VKTATIEIHDQIGIDWWTGEGITAKKFARDFKALEDAGNEKIIVSINSPGGAIFDGIGIFNTIRGSKVETECRIMGIAFSMAAVISQAGDKTSAYQNCSIMFHNGWGFAMGNAKDMRSYAEMLESLDDSLGLSISAKIGKTLEEVKATLMDYNDHWMTGQKAHADGLVDELLDGKSDLVPENISTMTYKDVMAMFSASRASADKHTKEVEVSLKEPKWVTKFTNLLNKVVGQKTQPQESGSDSANTTEITDMNIEETIDKLLAASGEEAVALKKVLAAAYKQTEIITPEDVIAENKIAVAIVEEKLNAQIQSKDAAIADLNTKISEMEAEIKDLKSDGAEATTVIVDVETQFESGKKNKVVTPFTDALINDRR